MMRRGLSTATASLRYVSPIEKIRGRRMALVTQEKNLAYFLRHRMALIRGRLAGSAALLENLSPLKVLSRGYSIVRTVPEGRVVREATDLSPGRILDIRFASGQARVQVKDILQK